MEYRRLLAYALPLVRGDDVRAVQQALIALQVQPPCGGADGIFGAATRDSVTAFQHSYNVGSGAAERLDEDGKVGPNSWAALFATVQARQPLSPAISFAAASPPPLGETATRRVKAWMRENFGSSIDRAVAEAGLQTTPSFDADTVYAIAAKEAAIYWLAWTSRLSPDQVLAHCVFDASGDAAGTSRTAFPPTTADFRASYPELTEMLIGEANAMRALRSLAPARIVYKGYGIFQYDLQHIRHDRAFFADRLWSSFDECLKRLITELQDKNRAALAEGETGLQETVRRYNGSGARARNYAANVMEMRQWCARA